MCFHGVPSHNFTVFHHSYTCGTDWPLTCLTGFMGPALSGLSPPLCFVFYSLQGWCIVQGLDANWQKFQCCMTRVVQILARKAVPFETGVCLFACGTSRIQLFIWSYSPDLRQSCKTRMIHTYSRRRFGTATPRKTANRQFSSFSGPKLPRKSGAKTRNPHTKTRKRAQIRISALMCFDKMYFIAAKLGLNGKFFWFSKAGQPPADTPSGLIAGCIAVAILGMLFNTLSGSDSSSWGPVLRLSSRSAFQLGIS